MASFATSAELATRLKKSFSAAEKDQADQFLAGASAWVRAVTGQTISEVVDDVWITDAPVSCVLSLPERPVTAVTSVLVDGEPVTDWVLRGSRLRRTTPWSDGCTIPEVEIVYTHGYPQGAEELDLAKDACLARAAEQRVNPNGYKSEKVDDYARSYGDGGTSDAWAGVAKALRKQYGLRPRTGSINTAV